MIKNKVKTAFIPLFILSVSWSSSFQLSAISLKSIAQPTIEELRLTKAQQALKEVVNRHQTRVDTFDQQLQKARNLTALTQIVLRHSHAIWQEAVLSFNQKADFDDRALYWARLKMSTALRNSPAFKQLLPMQQSELVWKFELLSRGQKDIKFDKNATIKILLTGFDPFHLDKNIKQSNPSGVSALAFDDFYISIDGKSIEIETIILPVRFADFDQGMVEELLLPWIKQRQVDMVLTVSMGRTDFDLERFPGLRRSATVSDNLNVVTGASAENPLIPLYKNKPLNGPEFLEFSLPVKSMQTAFGAFKINDNSKVQTLDKTFSPKSLAQLNHEISVQGSGGGYLSNEISYRSLLLREKYNPVLSVGHIHTPKIKGFDAEKSEKIVAQIKQMMAKAASKIK